MASISDYVHSLLEEYKDLRGKPKDSGKSPFWDVVVITTADGAQQTAFELQIEDKRQRHELPLNLPIHVISDPPGVRVGNGGSTLTVMETLHSIYGKEIFSLKIFLIHAGGWSQRMPSSSALGKIFSIIPHGSPPFQMLDLKLALYWPFVEKIRPGFFLVCADDFSVHNLGFDNSWEVSGTGFTALAHPSPMSLGRGHGVYVLDNPKAMDTSKHVVSMECVEVLQKPNDERMITRGALLEGKTHLFADGIRLDGDVCYTDSCFYFGADVTEKLLAFKREAGDLDCEIDAYGDFMQALGKNADPKYIHNTINVSQVTHNLISMRRKVYDLLHGSSIDALVLNASAYIHIGTASELLHHFCRDKDFQSKLSLGKDVFNVWAAECIGNGDHSTKDANGVCGEDEQETRTPKRLSSLACVTHSAMSSQSLIGDDTYVEFCDFHIPVHIQGQSIISNCQVCRSEASEISITIPPSTFLHSIPIATDGQDDPEYVTVVFNIEDNIKKSTMSQDVASLPFMGSDVGSYLSSCGLEERDVLPKEVMALRSRQNGISNGNNLSSEHPVSDVNANEEVKDVAVSLWTLKLYPSRPSMTSSFEDAVNLRKGKVQLKDNGHPLRLYSLADLIRFKDVKAMLDFRKELHCKIKSAANGV